ncbi:MAG: hypothetical protein IJ677_07765, partial [Alphaproteobacteria bacterium]|nr:hypothetical protein [Alphaproteobacteria bacterium]
MLRLTRTGLGLLTAQYRSVLRKCWAINVGIFSAMAEFGGKAADTLRGTLTAYGVNVFDVFSMLRLLDDKLFGGKGQGKGAPTVAGTFSLFGAENENVLDSFSAKRIFKTKLITTPAIGLALAATMMPGEVKADDYTPTLDKVKAAATEYLNSGSTQKYTLTQAITSFHPVTTGSWNSSTYNKQLYFRDGYYTYYSTNSSVAGYFPVGAVKIYDDNNNTLSYYSLDEINIPSNAVTIYINNIPYYFTPNEA